MYKLNGKHGEATIYSNSYNDKATSQIIEMLNQEWTDNLNIKIMPDFHAGAGCVIGTTINIKDKIIPNLVGVDIGCGMLVINMGKVDLNLQYIDNYIRNNIPHGFNINTQEYKFDELNSLYCYNYVNIDRALKSIGSLGGGNHFIEIDTTENGDKYLVIHSGSRNLGKQVAEYYQQKAFENCNLQKVKIQAIISDLKRKGKSKDIEKAIKKIKQETPVIQKSLSYLEGEGFKMYIHDMDIVQKFASLNRKRIAEKILNNFNISVIDSFETIHNYIEIDTMIMRKGAVSAKENEKLIIPMNMRDGCIVAIGKGNKEWNNSAPHGAGRLMSRGKAKEIITMKEFKDSMENIYSSSVKESTLDESPMAYKPMEEIVKNIKDTVDIIDIIKPIYNFKA